MRRELRQRQRQQRHILTNSMLSQWMQTLSLPDLKRQALMITERLPLAYRKERKVTKVIQANKAQKVIREIKVYKVKKVIKETQVRKAQRAIRAIPEHKDLRAIPEHKDLRAIKAIKVIQANLFVL
jgi:hypothetical protein